MEIKRNKYKNYPVNILKKTNPFILSAILCAFLIYTGTVKIKDSDLLHSLLPITTICRIEGKVVSNPIKCKNSKYYRAKMQVNYAFSKENIKTSCKGNIEVFLPSSYVEAFFPGRLYSIAQKNAVFCEKGANLSVSGKFGKNGNFFAEKLSQNSWENNIFGKIVFFRALCRLYFRRLMYGWGKAGGLFLALLSGIREYTEESLAENFRKAGLSHVLALSGMHLSLFSGITKSITSKILSKKLSCLLQLFSVFIFVWFAGLSPSLTRALICVLIMICASCFEIRTLNMKKVLSISFLLHIVLIPSDAKEIAFQLSYGAIAGILLFSDMFSILSIKFLPVFIANSIGASSGANSFTAPISAKKLGIISPIGIISSVIISPMINIFIYSGLILFLLSIFFPFTCTFAEFLMNIQYTAIKGIVIFFTRFPNINFGT